MDLFSNCLCLNKKNLEFNDRYSIKQTLLDGEFSKVKLIRDNQTKLYYILKEIDKNKINYNYYHELKSLIKLIQDNKYTVNFIEYRNYHNKLQIIFNKIEGLTLTDFLKKKSYQPNLLFLFYELIKGLNTIHYYNILHGDINPDNIMIKKIYDKYSIIYIDFGHSHCFDNTKPYMVYQFIKNQCSGRLLYCAPEVFFYQKYTYKADCWSLGIILYKILYGKSPYKKINIKHLNDDFFDKIRHHNDKYDGLLIKNMLNISYNSRWNTDNAITYLDNYIKIFNDI